MSSLPSHYPTLSIHLTDSTLHPLITSSSSPTNLEALTSLTAAFLTTQSALQRTHLGSPQHITVEYPDRGAVVVQSYLDPRSGPPASAKQSEVDDGTSGKADDGKEMDPALVAIVVANSRDDFAQAKRAIRRLEKVGRDFQKSWLGEDEAGER